MVRLSIPPSDQTPVDSQEFRLWFSQLFNNVNALVNTDNPVNAEFTRKWTFDNGVDISGSFLPPANNRNSLFVHNVISDKSVGGREVDGILVNLTLNTGTSSDSTTALPGVTSRVYAQKANSTDELWSFVGETWSYPGINTILVGGELAVVNQNDNQTSAIVGLDLPFKNRPDGATSPVNGLGANKYNSGSIAIQISAQGPSSAGENASWATGIKFQAKSLAPVWNGASNVPGIAIDMTALTSSDVTVALAFQQNVQIRWESGQAIRTYWDSASAQWRLDNSGSARFAVNTTSSHVLINTYTDNGIAQDMLQVNGNGNFIGDMKIQGNYVVFPSGGVSNQVLGQRQTGWTLCTGALLKGGWDSGAATLAQVAQTVAAIVNGSMTHGFFGT